MTNTTAQRLTIKAQIQEIRMRAERSTSEADRISARRRIAALRLELENA